MSVNNFFKSKLKFKPEVINGICPTCAENTLLVSLTQEFYRCMTCGTDLEQKVNGVIKYVIANDQTKFKASILPDEEDKHG